MNRPPGLVVSPFYYEAKNEIVRPDRGKFVTDYFVCHCMPQLGGLGTMLILFLSSRAGAIVDGSAVVEIPRNDITLACGCSAARLWRELRNNTALHTFVRVEEQYARNAKGHVRQAENAYFIAMDDPLLPEDESRLQEIIARKAQAPIATGRRVVPRDFQ